MGTIFQGGIEYSGGGATAYSDMGGATSSTAGVHGLVPAPASGDNAKFLRGDGTWAAAGGLHAYSATPHKVGTWIDGRDIMEATFYYDQLNTTYHNLKYVGFDLGWVTQAHVKLQSDNTWHSAPWLYWDGQNFISVHCQGGNIQIDVGPSGVYATEAYVTINYIMPV